MHNTPGAAAPALNPDPVIDWLERIRDFVASSPEAKDQHAIDRLGQFDAMLQALREVEGDHRYLNLAAGVEECIFCLATSGGHEPECSMHFVFAAIAKAEGRS